MLKLVGPLAAIALAGLLMMTVVLVALLVKVSTDPSRPIQVVLGAATPIPSLNEPSAFSAAYAERRIYVDSATSRAGYLDGRETVGSVVTATDAESDPLSYALGLQDPAYHYLWFEIDSSGQL